MPEVNRSDSAVAIRLNRSFSHRCAVRIYLCLFPYPVSHPSAKFSSKETGSSHSHLTLSENPSSRHSLGDLSVLYLHWSSVLPLFRSLEPPGRTSSLSFLTFGRYPQRRRTPPRAEALRIRAALAIEMLSGSLRKPSRENFVLSLTLRNYIYRTRLKMCVCVF